MAISEIPTLYQGISAVTTRKSSALVENQQWKSGKSVELNRVWNRGVHFNVHLLFHSVLREEREANTKYCERRGRGTPKLPNSQPQRTPAQTQHSLSLLLASALFLCTMFRCVSPPWSVPPPLPVTQCGALICVIV